MKYTLSLALLLLVSIGVLLNSCKKDPVVPENPYDKIDYGTVVTPPDTVGPATIVGLHRNLFSTRCALPGCHDGNFEPDFRTVQSSYSSLVYAPVIKNNLDSTFKYRVVPLKKEESVLYERITNCCFVNQDDRMPQDNIGVPLAQEAIDRVGEWISNGAKDINGIVAERPDLEPVFPFYFAVNTTFDFEFSSANNRIDSVEYNSFKIPVGTTSFYMVVAISDDITPLAQLLYNKLYISTSMDNFAGAVQIQATYFNVPNNEPVWLLSIPCQNFVPGQTYYMRYYVNDNQHVENSEFPKNSSVDYYKTYWSFIIQP